MNLEKSKTFYNVDQKEINKFKTLSSRWWNIKGEFQLLHRINPLRLSYIIHHSNGLLGKQVLDIGCGGGILSESMAREGAIVTGLDIEFNSLQNARFHMLESNVKVNYIQETIEEHAAKYCNKYDVITCMEMLEHVPCPQLVIMACAKLIKIGGNVFFSTINRNWKAWMIAIVFAEYIFRFIPKNTHNFKKFVKPAELLSWIDHTSLKEQHIAGIYYNPLIDKFRIGSNVDVNYILHTIAE